MLNSKSGSYVDALFHLTFHLTFIIPLAPALAQR